MYAFIFCCCKWLTSFLKLAGTFFYCSTTSLIPKNLIWEGRNFEVTSTKLHWTALNVSGGKQCVMPPTRRLVTTVLMHITGPLSKLKYIMLTSNNKRFRSAGDNDWRSKSLCFAYYISFTWVIVKTRIIILRVMEGPNAPDHIAFCAFHSFLVEVQTNVGYIYATHA